MSSGVKRNADEVAAGLGGVEVNDAASSLLELQEDEQQTAGSVVEGSNQPAKKKVKSGPRTSRACLGCRKQKMRCEGADSPPCKRCRNSGSECIFERRADYILNPEDSAWQKRVESKIDRLAQTVDGVIAYLSTGGPLPIPISQQELSVPADNTTTPTGNQDPTSQQLQSILNSVHIPGSAPEPSVPPPADDGFSWLQTGA